MARTHVTVVGAGPNGLAAAVAMARAGHSVTVHEAADRPGGGTRTEELTLPGFHHDVCSAVHPMGAASPFFRALPLADHGLDLIHPPICMAHPFDEGPPALLVRETAATAATLGRDGKAYCALLDPYVARWEDVIAEVLAPPLHVPRHPWLMARFAWHGLPSAMALVRRVFEGERARALFVGMAAHTLLPMDRAPSAAFGLVLGLAGHAVGWPIARGGSQRIADALISILREADGEVRTGSPVRSLEDLPDSDAFLLDLTPRQALKVAGRRWPARYRRHLERFRYAPGVFKVDWALSEPIPWRAEECRLAGTLHLGGSADAIARSAAAAWNGDDDDDPFVLLAQPSLFDATRAPAGRHTAWAYCHVPHGSTTDMTDAIERQVERFAPGFRDVVLARSTMNTRDVERHNPNMVGGDINGGVQDLTQFLFRPAPRLNPHTTPARDIFLCSASTPPGGAVHGMCGYHAAQAALRRLS